MPEQYGRDEVPPHEGVRAAQEQKGEIDVNADAEFDGTSIFCSAMSR